MHNYASTPGIAGKVLLARPDVADPNFERAVVYILAHSPAGAMGIVLNRPTEVDASDLVSPLAKIRVLVQLIYLLELTKSTLDLCECFVATAAGPRGNSTTNYSETVGSWLIVPSMMSLTKNPQHYGDESSPDK